MSSREYTHEEQAVIRRASALSRVAYSDLRGLGHKNSRRGKQRAIALIIGATRSDGRIDVDALQAALLRYDIVNEANYAQDMTKDSTDEVRGRGAEGLWTIHTHVGGWRGRGLHGHWQLTELGAKLAADYVRLVDRAAGEVQAVVSRTISIRPKPPACAYCREDVGADDRAECRCGSVLHATCLEECHRYPCSCCYGKGVRSVWVRSEDGTGGDYHDEPCASCEGVGGHPATTCVLSNTTVGCGGRYRIVAKPAPAAVEAGDELTAQVTSGEA